MPNPAIILNVDDNEPARYAKHRVLESAGYRVYDAGTGQSALDLAMHYKPSLVLCDVHLPDINGLEVCKRLKTGPLAASTLVLQISASDISGRHVKTALNNGADGYLTEPVDPDVLVSTVASLLRLRAAETELANTNQRLEKIIRELERSNADLRQFAELASRELREPLRTMRGFIDSLLEGNRAKLNQSALNNAELVQAGAKRMESLLDGIVALSSQGQLHVGAVKLGQVMDEAIGNLSQQVKDSGAQVSFGGLFLSKLPEIEGDWTQLVRVMQSLVSNAIQFSGAEPCIQIDCETGPANDCLISITDNGAGIPAAERERVFELFSNPAAAEQGRGLGLPLCRRIVEMHGGRIWAEAPKAGGTRIVISLPLAP